MVFTGRFTLSQSSPRQDFRITPYINYASSQTHCYIQISSTGKTPRENMTNYYKNKIGNRTSGAGLQDIATLMFKVKHILVPVNISDLFNLKNTQYNLRNSGFELPRFETVRFGRNSIKYMGPLIWSKLPRHLRMIETLNSFKRNIRKVVLSILVNI